MRYEVWGASILLDIFSRKDAKSQSNKSKHLIFKALRLCAFAPLREIKMSSSMGGEAIQQNFLQRFIAQIVWAGAFGLPPFLFRRCPARPITKRTDIFSDELVPTWCGGKVPHTEEREAEHAEAHDKEVHYDGEDGGRRRERSEMGIRIKLVGR